MAGVFVYVDSFNNLVSFACAGLTGLALLRYVIKYSAKTMKERGMLQGALLAFIYIFENIMGATLLLWIALVISSKTSREAFPIVLWAEIYVISIVYFYRRKHAEKRGLFSALLHLVILSLGWFTYRWFGMLLFSAPILFIFYYASNQIALAVIPASNPEDQDEIRQRRKVFLSYVWGLQMPFWNVSATNSKEMEKRLDGAPFNDIFPGLAWTHTHQVVGIANGINFRVEGPGVIFTRKGDQPFEIVDLRNQSRKSTIRAFSREGIPFDAIVTATFSIDRENWNPTLRHQLARENKTLTKFESVDRNLNRVFPYSHARVQAALRLRSKRSQPDGETEYWDDHVLSIAEEAAREVLAECNLRDLWLARKDENNAALDEISADIKESIEMNLRARGVKLISVKAAPDFSNEKEQDAKNKEVKDKVVKQQIDTWSVDRKYERRLTLNESALKAERLEQEARVYAHSVLLTAIAEGLQ
ncbi:MAG: hypothetical protein PHQ36_12540, partial [Anaerolineales bacterium]|nr:hypothetical protein [Anaerolineales bacterium]